MEIKKSDKNLLVKILSNSELEELKYAYEILYCIDNEKYRNMILRRINDVISIARYINLSLPHFIQEDYDCLAARISYLRITIKHVLSPSKSVPTISYSRGNNDAPRLLNSLDIINFERYEEVDSLLTSIFDGKNEEETLMGELKKSTGKCYQVLYVRNGDAVMIYNTYSNLTKLRSRDLSNIRSTCMKELSEGIDPVVQAIYDDMVYNALHFSVVNEKSGYRLAKENGITSNR